MVKDCLPTVARAFVTAGRLRKLRNLAMTSYLTNPKSQIKNSPIPKINQKFLKPFPSCVSTFYASRASILGLLLLIFR